MPRYRALPQVFYTALGRAFPMVWILAFWCGTAQNASSSEPRGDSQPVSIIDLAEMREIDSFGVSPNGRLAVVNVRTPDLEHNRYKIEWVLVSITNSFSPRFLADAGDVNLPINPVAGIRSGFISSRQFAWSDNGRYIAFIKGADQQQQLWLIDLNKLQPRQITDEEANVISFSWLPGAGVIEYFVASETRREREAYREDEDRRGLLYTYNRFVYKPSSSPSQAEHLEAKYYDIERSKVLEPAGSGLHSKSVYSEGQSKPTPSNAELVTLSPDKLRVAWVSRDLIPNNEGSMPVKRLAAHTEHDKQVICDHASCANQSFSAVWWSENSTEVFFAVGLGLSHKEKRIYAWDPSTDTLRAIYRSFDYLDQCELRGEKFFCLYGNPIRPNTIVAVDTRNGDLEEIFDPNPKFKHLQFGEVRRVTWRTKKWGKEESGYLVLPIGYEEERTYPIVVETYWFTGFLRGVHQEFPVHALAANGIAVFCVNRPAGGTGNISKRRVLSFDEIQRLEYEGNRYRAEPLDVMEAGLGHLVSMYSIDLDRIGLFGLSDGAQTVYYALTHSGRSYSAASVTSGGHTPSLFFLTSDEHRKRLTNTGFGFPYGEAWEVWRRSSPSIHAESVHTPLLVQVSDEEFYFSRETIESLKYFEKPIETHVFPNEHHVKWQPTHRFYALQRNLQWFQFWLQNQEVPSPVDKDQYVRWRKIRDKHCANMKADSRNDLPTYCETE